MATSDANLYPPIDFNLDFAAPDHDDDDDDDKSPAQKIHDSDTGPEGASESEAPLMHSVELDHACCNSVTPFTHSAEPERKEFWRFGPPIYGDTGDLIPVSVGPMTESDYAEWKSGSLSDGGYFPDGEIAWDLAVEKDMTLWDVFLDMAVAAREQVASVASGDLRSCGMAWLLELLEEEWQHKEGKGGGEEVNEQERLMNIGRILNAVPPRWMPDSSATSCMLCGAKFHPIMCPRHHCRFCGAIFCGECSKGRSLLPPSYRTADPQRVCDSCSAKLEDVQSYLMNEVSRAAQPPTHDLTDLSTLRSWLNFPWGQSMEYEIYKAANTIHGYTKVSMTRSERSIPESILKQAKGLAILTVANVGVMVTYKIGTGLVIARREDGSWSPPSAISTFGLGWGAQAGGELTDFIIVLRNTDAIRTFSGEAHLSVGAGLSAAVGIVGRSVEADFRVGDGGYAACYTYSCSKGAFVGCSLNGSMVTTRNSENARFYGDPSIKASDILLGSWPKPPAAAILYNALADLYQRL